MGSDNKGKGITKTIVEETKAVAVEVYKDAARPTVSQVGKTLELAVEVTLAIPNMILGGAKADLDKLSAAIKKKLGGVPDERLLPAPATIAAQAALHYLLLGESDKVRHQMREPRYRHGYRMARVSLGSPDALASAATRRTV